MIKESSRQSARFRFGDNWVRFLELVDDQRIESAQASLLNMLRTEELAGKRFLDIGSGSGLFSLAACNLGAMVVSFDYDEQSVACTRELKRRYHPDNTKWHIERGDALKSEYIDSLGKFDVVYAWGVLHHTGDMWTALTQAASCVDNGGQLFIAIYNDQAWLSKYWLRVKRLYNKGLPFRCLIIAAHAPIFLTRQVIKSMMCGTWRRRRGMSPWRDIIDWLGGYPFEVAKPSEIVTFIENRGFLLETITTVGGRQGCNQFVLRRSSPSKMAQNVPG